MKNKFYNKMLFILLICFIGSSTKLVAQQQLSFTYDVSGNQIERKIVCINCSTIATLNEVKLLELDILNVDRKFTTYPNPLTEVLNVQWSSTDGSYIKAIDVFSLNGVRIYHKSYTANQSGTDISFLNLSSGMYVLRAFYADGKQESVKVVKQ